MKSCDCHMLLLQKQISFYEERLQMDNKWWPILASVGVGAATYYTMSRRKNGMGQTIQKMIPLVAQAGLGMGQRNN